MSHDSWFSLPLSQVFYIVNQHSSATETQPALACQIGALLWLARGLLPSPSANTGLHSYHVSSHYQQIRAPGKQWVQSGLGVEGEGPEDWPSINPRAPSVFSLREVRVGRRSLPRPGGGGGSKASRQKREEMRRGEGGRKGGFRELA